MEPYDESPSNQNSAAGSHPSVDLVIFKKRYITLKYCFFLMGF